VKLKRVQRVNTAETVQFRQVWEKSSLLIRYLIYWAYKLIFCFSVKLEQAQRVTFVRPKLFSITSMRKKGSLSTGFLIYILNQAYKLISCFPIKLKLVQASSEFSRMRASWSRALSSVLLARDVKREPATWDERNWHFSRMRAHLRWQDARARARAHALRSATITTTARRTAPCCVASIGLFAFHCNASSFSFRCGFVCQWMGVLFACHDDTSAGMSS